MQIISEFPDLGPDVVALNKHSYSYLNILTEHGLPELTPYFYCLNKFLFEGVTL